MHQLKIGPWGTKIINAFTFLYIYNDKEIKKGGEGTIYLNETNRYKESTHLYLHFKMSNDEQIKEYLAAKLLTAQ